MSSEPETSCIREASCFSLTAHRSLLIAASSMRLRLVMFDMAGTTVDDVIDGLPLMVRSMVNAFQRHGFGLAPEKVHRHRGREKREAIAALLNETSADAPASTVEKVYSDFVTELERSVARVQEIDGTTAVFKALKSHSLYVGVGSGFPTSIVDGIVSQLRWQTQGLVDYVGTAERVGAGRPDPKMIYDAMQQLGIDDPRQVMKVGDTVVDVEEGKNAGAWTVAVLTGSQTEMHLKAANPDYILPSVRELPALLGRGYAVG